ncbi:alpha/beta fold hydrolase [Mesorhizobium sp. M7A.F.Ca.AU.002.06.1.1]|nr:alpha/beta fold hydrolase [Mesorhizobium sp. M7A.F.Ca.AU.002.06.1.1]
MATHPISIDSAGGEYMEAVLVIAWAVKPGDPVKAGDLVVTVETAKAATEIEADRDGWLAEIFFAEGQEAPVGAVLGTIADAKPMAGQPASVGPATAAAAAANPRELVADEASSSIRQPGSRPIASPLARRLAAAAGLDLAAISGSGPRGRIKKRDIDATLAARTNEQDGAGQRAPAAVQASPVAAPARQTVPVVLIHGFGADRSVWRQVVPLLGPGIETISLDLPGHGTEAARPASIIEEIAFLLSDRLEGMGVGNAHLVGHSLGGAAALALARLGRFTVRSVTLSLPLAGSAPRSMRASLPGSPAQQPSRRLSDGWRSWSATPRPCRSVMRRPHSDSWKRPAIATRSLRWPKACSRTARRVSISRARLANSPSRRGSSGAGSIASSRSPMRPARRASLPFIFSMALAMYRRSRHRRSPPGSSPIRCEVPAEPARPSRPRQGRHDRMSEGVPI